MNVYFVFASYSLFLIQNKYSADYLPPPQVVPLNVLDAKHLS